MICTLKECDNNHSPHCRTLSGCMCLPRITRGCAFGLPRAMLSHPIRGENQESPSPVRGNHRSFAISGESDRVHPIVLQPRMRRPSVARGAVPALRHNPWKRDPTKRPSPGRATEYLAWPQDQGFARKASRTPGCTRSPHPRLQNKPRSCGPDFNHRFQPFQRTAFPEGRHCGLWGMLSVFVSGIGGAIRVRWDLRPGAVAWLSVGR